MKKLLLLTLLSLNLFGACLEVGTTAQSACSNDTVRVDAISMAFTTNMKVSDNNLKVLEIPLYIFTDDTSSAIKMTINDVTALTKGSDSISTKFEYVQNNTVMATIANGVAFSILVSNASGRNGNSIVGYIRITVDEALSDTQTAGTYTLSKSMNVQIGNGSSSNSETLSASGTVEQVSMVGFENLATYKTGQAFKDGLVDYGNFTINTTNEQIKDLFVKNNTTGAFEIKFLTSALISQVDDSYEIGMKYYYTKTGVSEFEIKNDTSFTLMTGKKNGSKVGQMRFVTESLTGSLIAGEYKAVIEVTISVQ